MPTAAIPLLNPHVSRTYCAFPRVCMCVRPSLSAPLSFSLSLARSFARADPLSVYAHRRFDALVAKLREMAQQCLLLLRTELRCRVHFFIDLAVRAVRHAPLGDSAPLLLFLLGVCMWVGIYVCVQTCVCVIHPHPASLPVPHTHTRTHTHRD
jgi:hypothetical protein